MNYLKVYMYDAIWNKLMLIIIIVLSTLLQIEIENEYLYFYVTIGSILFLPEDIWLIKYRYLDSFSKFQDPHEIFVNIIYPFNNKISS